MSTTLPQPDAAVETPTHEGVFAPPPYLSPSSIDTFNTCPLKYKYSRIDKLPDPSGIDAIRGNYIHDALESLLALDPADRTVATARGLMAHHWRTPTKDRHDEPAPSWGDQVIDIIGDDPVKLREFRWGAWWCIENYFTLEDPTKITPAGLEHALDATIRGVRIKGYIDRWEWDNRGRIKVVDYKGLALDTPLPTPTGWTTMGNVRVGDELFAPDGTLTKVIGKSDVKHLPTYRISMRDGESIICDQDHLWTVSVGQSFTEKVLDVVALHEMRSNGEVLRIMPPEPVELPERAFNVDPYTLGVWLGDGSTDRGYVIAGHQDAPDIVNELRKRWGDVTMNDTGNGCFDIVLRRTAGRCQYGHPHVARMRSTNPDKHAQCSGCNRADFRASEHFPIDGSLKVRLRSLGLLGNKHIPTEYTRASIGQRLDLLRGLMDTDGSWNPLRKEAVFVTTSAALVEGITDLLAGLGCSYNVFGKGYTSLKGDRTAYQVKFYPTFNPFLLPRKAAQWTPPRLPRIRYISKIEQIDPVPTQCVAVDSVDSMYLCGRSMLPTHNSGRTPWGEHRKPKFVQLLIYGDILAAELNTTVGRLELLYLKTGDVLSSVPSAKDVDAMRTLVETTNVEITKRCVSGEFEPTPNNLCKNWCNYKTICPAWANKED